MKRIMVCALGVVMTLFAALPERGAALDVGVRGYFTYAALQGELQVDKAGVAGTNLNIQDRLGLGYVYYPSVEAFFGIGRHNLSLTYTQFDSSANKTLTSPITFKGKNFTGALKTDVNLRIVDCDYQYNFVQLKTILAGFSLGAIGKVKYLEGEIQLKSSGVSEKETFGVPIPMVGVGAWTGILADILEARAKATAMGYGDNLIYEGFAEVSLTPFPFLDIHGGYKISGIKVKTSDVHFKTDFAGPYVGLTVSF